MAVSGASSSISETGEDDRISVMEGLADGVGEVIELKDRPDRDKALEKKVPIRVRGLAASSGFESGWTVDFHKIRSHL